MNTDTKKKKKDTELSVNGVTTDTSQPTKQPVSAEYGTTNNNNSGGYNGKYGKYIDQLTKDYMNREPYSYDADNDKVFQQYKDRYTKLGEKAMKDTVGNAALLTGGYGNSYGVTASQQAYNDYMDALADKSADFENQAYQRWLAEGDSYLDKIGLLQNQDSIDYNRHRDEVGDSQWREQFEYGKAQDALAQENWQKNFDRSVYESDRAYNRDVLESDRNYNRSVYESDRSYEYKKAQDAMDKIYSSMAEDGGKFEVSDVAEFIKDYKDVYNSEEEFVYALATQFDDFGDDFYDYLDTIKSENGGTWLDIIMGDAGEMKDYLGDMSDNRTHYIPDSKANAEREEMLIRQQILKEAEQYPEGEIRNAYIKEKYKEYGIKV